MAAVPAAVSAAVWGRTTLCNTARNWYQAEEPDILPYPVSTYIRPCCRAGSSSEDETLVGKHAQLARLVSAAVVRMSLPSAKAAASGDRGGVLLEP